MTDPTELALRKAIVAEPASDLPRLVFADFLDERGVDGDAAMATFIRAGVELARTDEGDPKYPALLAAARRSGVLTAKTRRPWLDSIPGATVSFHRGMIAGVALPPDVHRKHDQANWECVPVEQLKWIPRSHGEADKWNEKIGTALASRPELERVRTLVTDGGAGFLAPLLTNSANLAGLQALVFNGWTYREPSEQLVPVAERLNLPSLDSVHFQGSLWPPVEWRPFVQAVGARLRRLHLIGRNTFGSGWDEEYDRTWFSEFASTPLRHGVFWMDNSETFSNGGVDLVEQIGDVAQAERAIIGAPQRGDPLTLSGRRALRQLHVEQGFETIDVSGISYLDEAARLECFSSTAVYDSARFAAGTKLKSLRNLRLTLNVNGPVILTGGYCPRLHRLDLAHDFDDRGLSALLSADLRGLRSLNLHVNDASVAELLLTATNMPNLCTLVLGGIRQDAKHLKRLLERLAKAPGLPHLSLVRLGTDDRWWVLGGGKATPVVEGIDPVWRDWWDPDPTGPWF